MSMLAERRRKTKWVLNPTKKPLWTAESNGLKLGKELMEKMGWAPGKGLGLKEQGIQEPLKVSYKNDNKGMGFKGNEEEWTEQQDEFNSLLCELSKNSDCSNAQPAEPGKNEIKSLEEKSRLSRARVHYKKFTRGKDMSLYSEHDLACILGKKEKKKAEEKPEKEVEEPKPSNGYETTFGVTTINSGSIQDYFKQKWKTNSLKSERLNSVVDNMIKDSELNSSNSNENLQETEIVQKTHKKRKHSKVEENECENSKYNGVEEETKNNKKKKNTVEQEVNEVDSQEVGELYFEDKSEGKDVVEKKKRKKKFNENTEEKEIKKKKKKKSIDSKTSAEGTEEVQDVEKKRKRKLEEINVGETYPREEIEVLGKTERRKLKKEVSSGDKIFPAVREEIENNQQRKQKRKNKIESGEISSEITEQKVEVLEKKKKRKEKNNTIKIFPEAIEEGVDLVEKKQKKKKEKGNFKESEILSGGLNEEVVVSIGKKKKTNDKDNYPSKDVELHETTKHQYKANGTNSLEYETENMQDSVLQMNDKLIEENIIKKKNKKKSKDKVKPEESAEMTEVLNFKEKKQKNEIRGRNNSISEQIGDHIGVEENNFTEAVVKESELEKENCSPVEAESMKKKRNKTKLKDKVDLEQSVALTEELNIKERKQNKTKERSNSISEQAGDHNNEVKENSSTEAVEKESNSGNENSHLVHCSSIGAESMKKKKNKKKSKDKEEPEKFTEVTKELNVKEKKQKKKIKERNDSACEQAVDNDTGVEQNTEALKESEPCNKIYNPVEVELNKKGKNKKKSKDKVELEESTELIEDLNAKEKKQKEKIKDRSDCMSKQIVDHNNGTEENIPSVVLEKESKPQNENSNLIEVESVKKRKKKHKKEKSIECENKNNSDVSEASEKQLENKETEKDKVKDSEETYKPGVDILGRNGTPSTKNIENFKQVNNNVIHSHKTVLFKKSKSVVPFPPNYTNERVLNLSFGVQIEKFKNSSLPKILGYGIKQENNKIDSIR